MRQARELGLTQRCFGGVTMVDQNLIAAARQRGEGASGSALVPFLPGSDDSTLKAWEAKWKPEYPNLPAGRPNIFDLLSYGDMYVLAEGLKRAGPDPTTDKLIAALEGIKNYRVSGRATPGTFTPKHHIGNLHLLAVHLKNGQWVPLGWEGKHPSDILKRYQ